jgi:hypothetical protein
LQPNPKSNLLAGENLQQIGLAIDAGDRTAEMDALPADLDVASAESDVDEVELSPGGQGDGQAGVGAIAREQQRDRSELVSLQAEESLFIGKVGVAAPSDPWLPDGLPWLELEGVPVGDGLLTLSLRRGEPPVAHHPTLEVVQRERIGDQVAMG